MFTSIWDISFRDNHPSQNVVNDDLMGLWVNWNPETSENLGQRLNVTTLDLKVLEDLGYLLQSDVARQEARDIFEPIAPSENDGKELGYQQAPHVFNRGKIS